MLNKVICYVQSVSIFPGGSVVKNLPASSVSGWEDPLEKEMASRFSILAWEIPWTEESGELQSMCLSKSWTQQLKNKKGRLMENIWIKIEIIKKKLKENTRNAGI